MWRGIDIRLRSDALRKTKIGREGCSIGEHYREEKFSTIVFKTCSLTLNSTKLISI